MPEPTEQAQQGGESATGGIQSALTRQIGPLKTWQWGVAIGGGYLLYRVISGKGLFPASSSTGTGNPQAAADSTGTGSDLPPVTNITNNYYGKTPGGQANADPGTIIHITDPIKPAPKPAPITLPGPGSGTSTSTSISKTISTVHITPPPASSPVKTTAVAHTNHPSMGPAPTFSAESIQAQYVTTPQTFHARTVAANVNPVLPRNRPAAETNTQAVTRRMVSAQANNTLTPLNATIGGSSKPRRPSNAPAYVQTGQKEGVISYHPARAKKRTTSTAGGGANRSKAV